MVWLREHNALLLPLSLMIASGLFSSDAFYVGNSYLLLININYIKPLLKQLILTYINPY
jgi:hypothetical protein